MTFIQWWHHPNRRPLWQLPITFVALLIYWPARAYVDWMDRK